MEEVYIHNIPFVHFNLGGKPQQCISATYVPEGAMLVCVTVVQYVDCRPIPYDVYYIALERRVSPSS